MIGDCGTGHWDLDGARVLVVGEADGARRVLARHRAAGAQVRLCDAEAAIAELVAAAAEPSTAHFPALITVVGGDCPAVDELRGLARRLRVPVLSTEPLPPTPAGWVSLVGGGPGDPGLLTGRAVRAIGEADVVLHDRLCPREALLDLAPGAELIDVGKRPGHHAMPQEEIERLMVDRARRGLRVVRLKGGDPFVFGRGGEEVLTCRRAGVPVEVVPGVSSAIAVPAAAGIPVTHRGVTHAFTVISAHAGLGEDELQQLAQLGGTIVVLMGVGTLDQVLDGLRRHGMSDHTPVAIIERGFSADERRLVSTIGAIGAQVPEFAPVSPAVIVIGAVVAALTENVSGSAPLCETDPDTKTVLGPVLQALGPS